MIKNDKKQDKSTFLYKQMSKSVIKTIATFRNRYAWMADSRIGNWSTDLLSHFFIILYHLIAHKIVYDRF